MIKLMKYKILGYIFLGLVFAATVVAVYWWQYGQVSKQEIDNRKQSQVDETANWQTYRNATYGFEFQHPSTYSFQTSGHYFLKELVVEMTSDVKYPGTNFSGSGLSASIGADTKKCLTNIRDSTKPLTEEVTVNEVVFYRSSFTGAAAGTAYTSDIYRTIRANSLCFEVAFTYGVTNRQNLDNPNSVKEFDPKQELAINNQIFSTFKFID